MYEVAVPDDALTEEDEDILNYDDIDDPDAFASVSYTHLDVYKRQVFRYVVQSVCGAVL